MQSYLLTNHHTTVHTNLVKQFVHPGKLVFTTVAIPAGTTTPEGMQPLANRIARDDP